MRRCQPTKDKHPARFCIRALSTAAAGTNTGSKRPLNPRILLRLEWPTPNPRDTLVDGLTSCVCLSGWDVIASWLRSLVGKVVLELDRGLGEEFRDTRFLMGSGSRETWRVSRRCNLEPADG